MDWTDISAQQFQNYIEILNPSIDDYLYVYDFLNDYYCISANALERFCIPMAQFHDVVERHREFVYPPDVPALQRELEEVQSGKKNLHNLEYRWLDRDGKPVWINCRGVVLTDKTGKASMLVGCINEIGRNQKADNVSGLLRETALSREMAEHGGGIISGFVLRIGIDNFKEINENKGLDYGDMVLQKTAECVEKVLLTGQHLYRLVADEFAIVDFTGRNVIDAKKAYDKISNEIAKFIEDNQYEVFYTVSGGIVVMDELTDQNFDNVMRVTEFSLNKAKEVGRNQYYIFDASDYERFRHKRWLLQIMRKAINHNFEGFEAYYQPIVDIQEGVLCGAETLLRFRTPETGMVSPGEFIPILEDSGLIVPVGSWVMDQALKACSIIRKELPDFRISVNVSFVQVLKSDILGDIIQSMKKYALTPGSLVVELTESGMLENNPRFRKFCAGLKNYGIRLALDDFGTGYSNFHYLYSLNPNTIKIDRSFTVQAIRNENEYNLLRHMVEMTHGIDLKLCIEGVETKEELEKISRIHPDYIQGYYFGRPSPFTDFMENHVKSTNLA